MKKLSLLITVAIVSLSACKEKTKSVQDTKNTDTSMVATSTTVNDSAAIRAVVVDFYTWYNKNYKQLIDFNLYSGVKKADKPPYKINWTEVDKLQAFIKSSVPFLGEEYLANQKRMLEKADSAFKVDVEDEVPYAFDYDWYTNSQEDPQYTLDEVNKGKWSIQQMNDRAIVVIKNSNNNGNDQTVTDVLKLTMKKEASQWKIAKIGDDL